MSTTIRDRVAAATGAADVVLIGVGNVMSTAGTDQSAHPGGAQVLRDVNHQAQSTGATVGLAMEVLGFAAFMVFLGYLAHAFYGNGDRRASGAAAGTALVAGVTMLAIKLGSAAPMLVLFLDRDHLSPQLAQVLNDLNGAAFVVSWLPLALFVAAAAAALHQVGLVGRPTAYLGMIIGAAGLALALVGINDPAAANPAALMLAMLWLLAVSVRLAVTTGTGSTSGGGEHGASTAPRESVGA